MMSMQANGLQAAYATKPKRYFGGVREDYLCGLRRYGCRRVLEIGCGVGDLGAQALSGGDCEFYAGIELFDEAAGKAETRLSQVVGGDVESVSLPWKEKTFDALIMSEVLEHLRDPGDVLRRLRPLLVDGGRVFASSPNAAHHSVIRMLWRGEWNAADYGIMDRTHLRWFTPASYQEMFERAGFGVDRLESISELTLKQRLLCAALLGRRNHLFWGQINLQGHAPQDHGLAEPLT
jgi:2-polyprenyl-3-methyl-5-hydroxy-6-metoxy-1,4-benzoquinol methylase